MSFACPALPDTFLNPSFFKLPLISVGVSMKLFTKVAISTGMFGFLSTLAQAATITIGSLTAVTNPGNVGTIAPGNTLFVGDAGSPTNILGLNSNLYNNSTTATKTFFDDFVFTLPTALSLYSIDVSLNTSTFAGISGFSESLYSGGYAGPSFSTTNTNPLVPSNLIVSTSSNTLSFSNLAAGTYTLQFSGTLAAATTKPVFGLPTTVPTVGAYASLISVSAVPEPESYAMLIAGLGLIGAAVKRREIKQA
jgi:hypothetical protein